MSEIALSPSIRMPSVVRLLGTQIAYQARLLAGGRTITIGVGLPVILLISSHGLHGRASITDVAGYSAFGLTLTAWNTYGVRLVAAREAGVLKRWRATPLPHWCYFLGRILATVVVSVLAGVATVAAGVLLYGTHLTVGAGIGLLVALVLGALAWSAVATAVTALIPTLEAAAPTLLLTYFPIIVISGIFGASAEPHWLSTLASYLPAQPLVHALAVPLAHQAGQSVFAVRDLGLLALWSAVGLAVAVVTFRWEPHRPSPARPAHPAGSRDRSKVGGSRSDAREARRDGSGPSALVATLSR